MLYSEDAVSVGGIEAHNLQLSALKQDYSVMLELLLAIRMLGLSTRVVRRVALNGPRRAVGEVQGPSG
jgi:hypothetical protein